MRMTMKKMTQVFLSVAILGILVIGCPNPTTSESDPDLELTPSTIVFTDGASVTRQIGSGNYTNTVSGVGDGTIIFSSSAEATAIVNTSTGEVTLVAVGTTVITASKTATKTHAAVSASYDLIISAITSDGQSLTFITVPAGSFQRDTTSTNISIISHSFRMSQHEITREQFQTIIGTDPVVIENQTAYSSGTTDPVTYINSYHTIAFCNKLSLAEGLTPVYSVNGVDFSTLTYASIPTTDNADWNAATVTWTNNGYRLPTEMEWLWAAMGATSDRSYGYTGSGVNTTGYTKAFAGSTGSNSIGDYVWYNTNSSSKTHPVGSKVANELGLYDMSGNVLEWCWDWHGAFPTGILTDYRGAASRVYKVLRGGSRISDRDSLPFIYRGSGLPYSRSSTSYGFRVVLP